MIEGSLTDLVLMTTSLPSSLLAHFLYIFGFHTSFSFMEERWPPKNQPYINYILPRTPEERETVAFFFLAKSSMLTGQTQHMAIRDKPEGC